jgi:perosamine synthetase
MIDNLVCSTKKSLLEAMHIINENTMGICFIVDDSKTLKGVLTDGDIRRAILSGKSLDGLAINISNDIFVYGYQNEDTRTLLNKLDDKVRTIPIVNQDHKLVNYFRYSQDMHFPVALPNLSGNEFKYLIDAFTSTWISSSGIYLDKFEHEFSKYSDCSFGVAVSNGTVALHLALVALDIGDGDEVIIPDLTFAATINAVLHANATPVIVDIEEESWCISPSEIEKAITERTRAIIPVHLYGQPCDMESIMSIATRHNLKVIEDCAEAHGSSFGGKKVGSFGDIGCFSFYGNKVITTGEGGMCVTNNSSLDEKMRILRDHGMSKTKKYWHDHVGFNYRLTNLQAAIGLAQLERIDEIHHNRREYENAYKEVLGSQYSFQSNLPDRDRITWLVGVLVNKNLNREDLMEKFTNMGIDVRPFFYPLSEMDIYKKFSNLKTPISEKISKRGLNLPTYESLKSVNQIKEILNNIVVLLAS